MPPHGATSVGTGSRCRTLIRMSKARMLAQRRFPPWQVFELQGGYAVEDAQGRRLGTFYATTDTSTAKHAGALTLDEARQMAFDLATLPELLQRVK